MEKRENVTMTIEESVKMDSSKFQAILEDKKGDIKDAFQELSAELDEIIREAIDE